METVKYNWETEFRTTDDLMVHTFSDRVQVVTNIKTGEIKTLIDRRNDLVISEYATFLLKIAEDYDKLKGFSNDNNGLE